MVKNALFRGKDTTEPVYYYYYPFEPHEKPDISGINNKPESPLSVLFSPPACCLGGIYLFAVSDIFEAT